jgi:uncharacterized protein GlcG (DUF336 family)
METFLDRAQRAVSAGIAYARERDLKMTIVVMDITGTVCAAARMDRSRTITYEIATAKANTAREFQTSTAELKELIKPENKIAIESLAPRIAFLGGGLPITVAGEQIGALGTSGGAEDQDIECADVCLAAGFGGA